MEKTGVSRREKREFLSSVSAPPFQTPNFSGESLQFPFLAASPSPRGVHGQVFEPFFTINTGGVMAQELPASLVLEILCLVVAWDAWLSKLSLCHRSCGSSASPDLYL